MLQAIREQTIVKVGGLLELRHPELLEGTAVEIVIMLESTPPTTAIPPTLASLIGLGRGCFTNAQEVDDFVRSERDAWER